MNPDTYRKLGVVVPIATAILTVVLWIQQPATNKIVGLFDLGIAVVLVLLAVKVHRMDWSVETDPKNN